jgi:hypothetical protein
MEKLNLIELTNFIKAGVLNNLEHYIKTNCNYGEKYV